MIFMVKMCEKIVFLKNIKNEPYICTVFKDELKRTSVGGERSLCRAEKNAADRLREPKTMSRRLRTESCRVHGFVFQASSGLLGS